MKYASGGQLKPVLQRMHDNAASVSTYGDKWLSRDGMWVTFSTKPLSEVISHKDCQVNLTARRSLVDLFVFFCSVSYI